MFSRSSSCLFCLFVAVSTARNFKEPVSIKEWSVVESEQKFKETAGSTQVEVDRATVAARIPEFAAMFQHYAMGPSSGQRPVPNMEDPILRQLLAYLPNIQGPELPIMAPQLLSVAHTEGEPNPKPECEQQVEAQLSSETAVATAVHAIKHSCDSTRQAAADFIKDHLGQVVGAQGRAHAILTQPEEVAQLSRLLSDRLAEASTPAAKQTRTTPTAEADSDDNDSAQRQASAVPPAATCPTTPLDEDAISSLRSLSQEEKDGRLVEVTKNGEVEELRTLLAAGAFPRARDIYGRTALHCAAWKGNVEATKCLLDAGAEVDTTDNEEYQPLHMAAIGGNPTVVRLLASRGADPNARDIYEWTPLHLSVRESQLEAARALLDVGASRVVRNKTGFTPLELARRNENQPLIDTLTQS